MDFIGYGRQLVDEDDVQHVAEVLRSDWLTQGPKVAQFEQAVAARCGARYAVACSSGTAALHLAALAAKVGAGHELVVPAITFLATANCGVYVGATPKFCDVELSSVLMTAELLGACLSEKTRAVLPVHFAGLACDMASIASLVRARCPDAVIIEDASHALGASHADGTPVGALKWADMAVFSFHPIKHITAGEGGIVLTDRADLAERLRLLRNHGMTKETGRLTRADEGPWYYEMHEVGFNYRIPDINCALALSQLSKLDRFVVRRRKIAAYYRESLSELPHTELPPFPLSDRSAWHLFCLHIDFAKLGKSRRQVVAELRERGVGTQVHYFPVPLQPYYQTRFGFRHGMFPGAERHYAEALTIPLYPAMSDDDAARVVDALREVIR
jgi:UDP-4-amino-4,6-dideoxy-N-acetyl-beta-L-altrosamine transaminase